VPDTAAPRWLVLIHQIPNRPPYLRVKVGRRLQGLGAVGVKNSVYVLPRTDDALEDFQWVRREIVGGGGEASVLVAHFIEGLSDPDLERLFNAAREAEYAALAKEARALQVLSRGRRGKAEEKARVWLQRLRKRLTQVVEVDFFGASGRDAVEGPLAAVEAALRPKGPAGETKAAQSGGLKGRTWVTRIGIHIDRIGSAWLIRRFIDAEAHFRFLKPTDPVSGGELRFDMFEGEFTHEGELCTFEVLLRDFALEDPALSRLGEIVHSIDLKDGRYSHPETAGLDHVIAGIALRHKDDEGRLRDGAAAFEGLYEYFKGRR
jgi:hypothetical protein